MAISLNLGNLLVHLRADTLQYDMAMKKAVGTMMSTTRSIAGISLGIVSKLGSMLKSFGAWIGKWAKRIGIALLAIGAMSVKAFASFDDAMIKSLAIMGDVSEVMQSKMRDLARTLATESITSATELAKSYFFLASAGLSAKQSMAALATVDAFAIAGAFDMAEATDLLTDAQSALGLTVDDATENMRNMTRVSDVLTGANTLANASTRQFSLALTTQAGPAIKGFNVSLEQGVAVLAAYADQGIKGQRAGTMFSRMLRLMTKGFRDNTAAWRRLGISIFDSKGELLEMGDIVHQLTEVLSKMSTRQKGNTLEMLGFQARSQQTILPLLGMGDAIETYNMELEKMGGITEEVKNNQLKSFSSQMKILWNNIKDIGISIGGKLVPGLETLAKWFEKHQELIKKWAVAFTAYIIFVKDVLWNFLKFMKNDWKSGIELAFDVTLELAEGFAAALVMIMKDAGIKAGREFSQAWGRQIGSWLINQSGVKDIHKLTPGKAMLKYPISGLLRYNMLVSGQSMFMASFQKFEDLNTKSKVKQILKDTTQAVKELITAAEELSGMDIMSGPLKKLQQALGSYDPLLDRLNNTPIGKALGVKKAPSGSILERRFARQEKMVKDHVAKMRKEFMAPFIRSGEGMHHIAHGGFIILDDKAGKYIKRQLDHFAAIEKRGLEKIAAQRAKILGGKKDMGTFIGMIDKAEQLAEILRGRKNEGFEIFRPSIADPRSTSNPLLSVNRQILMEQQKQTRSLDRIEEKTLQ